MVVAFPCRTRFALLGFLGALGCGAPAVAGPSDGSSGEVESSGPATTSTTAETTSTGPGSESTSSADESSSGGESAESGPKLDVGVIPDLPTGDETGVEFDCSDIPDLPVDYTIVRDVYGAEDLEFDGNGNLVIAVRGTNALFLYPREGAPMLLNPDLNLASITGTAILPDGDIVVADEGQSKIARVNPDDGTVTYISYSGSGSNGLVVGNDGFMYAASYGSGVLRIDPEDGTTQFLYDLTSGIDGITFGPDYDLLYFNEGEIYQAGDGRLFRGHLDGGEEFEEVEDLGPPLEATQGTVDGMTADVCGNVYIATQNVNNGGCAGSSVVRVTPEDEPELVTCFGNSAFTPSLTFGSGLGDWELDSLYVIDWYGKIYEVPVGVPGRPLPHL